MLTRYAEDQIHGHRGCTARQAEIQSHLRLHLCPCQVRGSVATVELPITRTLSLINASAASMLSVRDATFILGQEADEQGDGEDAAGSEKITTRRYDEVSEVKESLLRCGSR